MVDDQYQQYRRRFLLDQLHQKQYVTIDSMFYDDDEIVSLALNVGRIQVKNISERLRDHLEIARLAIEKNAYHFQDLSERLKDDTEIARLAVEKASYNFQYLSERLKDDTEFARFAIEKDAYNFQYLSERLKDDTEIARLAIEKDACNFQYLSERLKNNRQYILTAANHNLYFFIDHPQFQDDDEIYLISKEKLLKYTQEINPKNIDAPHLFALFAYLPTRFDEDDDLYTLIKSKFMEYLEFMPTKRLNDMTANDKPLLFASNRLIHDEEVYQMIKDDYLCDIYSQSSIFNDRLFLELPGSKRFLSDFEILKETFFYNIKVLAYVSNEFQSSKELITTAVEINPLALQFASEQLKDDDDLVHLAVEINPLALQFASERLKDDDDLVHLAVEINPLALQFASERLKDDDDLVHLAVEINPLALQFASERFQLDENLQLKFVLHPTNQERYKNIVKDERDQRKYSQNFNISEEFQKSNVFIKSKFDLFFQSVNIDHQLQLIEKEPSFLEYFDPIYLEKHELLIFKIIDLDISLLKYINDQMKKRYITLKINHVIQNINHNIDDEKLILIRNNPSYLSYLDDQLKDDEFLISKLIDLGINCLEYASDRLKNHKDLVLKAIKSKIHINQYNRLFIWKYNQDEEVQLEIYKNSKNLTNFPLIENHLRENYLIDLKTKETVDYFPPQYQDDDEFVKEAISINVDVFMHISDRLKSDKDIQMMVILKDRTYLQYANDDIRNDQDFMMNIIQQFPDAIFFASKDLQLKIMPMIFENLSLIINQIKESTHLLNFWIYFFSQSTEYDQKFLNQEEIKQLLDNDSFLLDQSHSIFDENYIIKHLSDRLKANEDFIIAFLKQYHYNAKKLFKFVHASLKDNEKFIERLIKRQPYLFEYASDRLKDDEKFIEKLMRNYSYLFEYASDRLKDDEKFILNIIRQRYDCSNITPHISARLKDHNRLMTRLIKQNTSNAEYASDRIKSLLDPKVKSRINPKDESN